MVHGFLSSNAQWIENIDALSKFCTPVTAELFGHGRSPSPVDVEYYHPSRYVSEFEKIRQDLNTTSWFVCGYSLGAALTARYSCLHFDQVIGHIMTNSNSAFASESQSSEWKKTAKKSGDNIQTGGLPAIEKIPIHPRHATKLPSRIYAALEQDSALLNPIGIANTLRATTPNASIRALAIENHSPALLCWGTQEKRFLESKIWAEINMPKLEIKEIEAGHAVNMQKPQEFNQTVQTFLKKCATL